MKLTCYRRLVKVTWRIGKILVLNSRDSQPLFSLSRVGWGWNLPFTQNEHGGQLNRFDNHCIEKGYRTMGRKKC